MPTHLLVTNDYPPKVGGIQVYLHELWRRLPPGRATVLTATSHDDAAAFDSSTTVVIERSAHGLLFFPSLRVWRQIESAISRHQPDLVVMDPAWPLGLLGPFLSRPFGVVLHGAEVTIPARIPLVSSTLRFVLRRARVAICAGSYPESEARRCAGDRLPPVVAVVPGVDCERFAPRPPEDAPAVREALGLRPDAFLVSSYSRLVPRKGMDTLIRAAALLRHEIPELQIAIGGDGRDRPRLERLARTLHAPVVFVGRVSDEILPRWLAGSDVMAMACRNRWWGLEQEGFGIVFAEASACGIPVVAGRSGGSHDAVVDGVTGRIVDDPRNASELAAILVDLYRHPATRRSMGEAGRRHALEAFDWSVLATQLDAGLQRFGG